MMIGQTPVHGRSDTGPTGQEPASFSDIPTGVSLFDTENRELGSLVRSLLEESRAGTDAAYLRGRFDMLNRKFRSHFAHEDEYMLHSGFPDRKLHSEDHARLADMLDRMIAAMDDSGAGESSFVTQMERFFGDTLPVHLTLYDCPLGRYLNSKGIR